MRSIHIIVVLSLLLVIVPVTADSTDAEYFTVRLSAVYPTEGYEGFALTNYSTALDIKGYSVSDGEGTVSFTSSLIIHKAETVYFCKSEPPSWMGFDRTIVYGQNGVTMKGFALADSGDDIYLMKGDEVIDAFVYGTGKAIKGGWNGEPFEKISKKHMAVRGSPIDTNSVSDWKLIVPGKSEFKASTFDATVTPISFPDDHQSFFYALQSATSSIDISVYLISHPRIVSSLLSSLAMGVHVRILVEGSPAGGMTSSEIKALKTLSTKGADVRVMKQTDGYRAYSYIHNKYAVIDGTTTIITSENWQKSSFESNRGWGAVIESEDYSRYMEGVFESDFNRSWDVVSFDSLFPTSETDVYEVYQKETENGISYRASVTPMVSPDNSYKGMKTFIRSAQQRVYSEQLDVEYTWTFEDDNPISWMTLSNASDRRLIVDVTFDDRNDSDFKDGYGVIDALAGSKIDTREPVFSGLVHNKGVIVDHMVWIGSVNWTYSSFTENREAAVIIESEQIADYFASLFLSDWGSVEGSIDEEHKEPFVIEIGVQNKGNTFLLEAIGADDDMVCKWDLDGDGIYETEGRKIVREFTEGHHTISLSVEDGTEVKASTISIDSRAEGDGFSVPMKYYPIIVICVLILVYNLIRWSRGRHDTDKRILGKRYGRSL